MNNLEKHFTNLKKGCRLLRLTQQGPFLLNKYIKLWFLNSEKLLFYLKLVFQLSKVIMTVFSIRILESFSNDNFMTNCLSNLSMFEV